MGENRNDGYFFLHSQPTCATMVTTKSALALLQEQASNPVALLSEVEIGCSTKAELLARYDTNRVWRPWIRVRISELQECSNEGAERRQGGPGG